MINHYLCLRFRFLFFPAAWKRTKHYIECPWSFCSCGQSTSIAFPPVGDAAASPVEKHCKEVIEWSWFYNRPKRDFAIKKLCPKTESASFASSSVFAWSCKHIQNTLFEWPANKNKRTWTNPNKGQQEANCQQKGTSSKAFFLSLSPPSFHVSE